MIEESCLAVLYISGFIKEEVNIMTNIRIERKSVRNVDFIKSYSMDNLKIYEKVTEAQAKNIGFREVGDVITPSQKYGSNCYKNINGYTYADKTKPKESRVVATFYMHPYGNRNSEEVLVDISRDCYPRVNVEPYGIEIELLMTESEELFVSVILNENIKKYYLKEAMNIMLEIFGGCYIGDTIKFSEIRRRRVNWILLPQGTKPSDHIRNLDIVHNEYKRQFIIDRFEYLEACEVEEIVQGLNSFQGYYAFVMKDYCILESAIYGNATYILRRENWEEMSKKTKGELLEEHNVVARIEHTKNWQKYMKNQISPLEKSRECANKDREA